MDEKYLLYRHSGPDSAFRGPDGGLRVLAGQKLDFPGQNWRLSICRTECRLMPPFPAAAWYGLVQGPRCTTSPPTTWAPSAPSPTRTATSWSNSTTSLTGKNAITLPSLLQISTKPTIFTQARNCPRRSLA